jgi:hypothetical protein
VNRNLPRGIPRVVLRGHNLPCAKPAKCLLYIGLPKMKIKRDAEATVRLMENAVSVSWGKPLPGTGLPCPAV